MHHMYTRYVIFGAEEANAGGRASLVHGHWMAMALPHILKRHPNIREVAVKVIRDTSGLA